MALTNEKPLAGHITAGAEDGFLTTAGVIKDEKENQSIQDTLNAKYTKSANGIPKADLDASVRESLDKADTAAQPEDLAAKQDKLTSENAGANITIAEESGVLKISAENTEDYDSLIHKPAISGAEITKDSTASSLGLATLSQVNSKQPKIDENHKVSADHIDDLVSEKKLVTNAEKETWTGKQDKLTSENAGANITITEEGGIVKISSSGGAEDAVQDVLFDGVSKVDPTDHKARLYTDEALASAKTTGGIGYQASGTNTVTWDGDTTGKDTITINDVSYYKISTLTPAKANMVGATLLYLLENQESSITIEESYIQDVNDDAYLAYMTCIVTADTTIQSQSVTAGIWFSKVVREIAGVTYTTLAKSLSWSGTVIHKIDPETYIDTTEAGSAGKALLSDGSGGVTWGDAGKVDDVLFDDVTVLGTDKKARLYTDAALKSAKETNGIGWQETGLTITWDGTTAQPGSHSVANDVTVKVDPSSEQTEVWKYLYIVSDTVLTETQVLNGTWKVTINSTVYDITGVTYDTRQDSTNKSWHVCKLEANGTLKGQVIIVEEDNTMIDSDVNITHGTWFRTNDDHSEYVSYFYHDTVTKHTIDYNYINSGDSTNVGKFLKATTNGGVTWETVTTLRPMKSSWTGEESEITTQAAAEAILSDSEVTVGDGYLATVMWTDLPSPLSCAEVKAFVISDSIVQFELTSADTSPYAWFYNSWDEGPWRSYVPLVDNLTTNNSTAALTAKQGKVLQDTKQDNLPAGQNDQYLHKNAETGAIEWADVQSGGTEVTTVLETDLYTYTNIGKITGATQTNPVLVAEAGDSLKDVFDAILGTEVDVDPTINQSGTTFTKSAQTGTTSVSGAEIGTAVAAQTGTVTFKVTNTAVANYGLKAGSQDTGIKKTIVNTTFNYPVLTRQINTLDYQICIAYPVLNGCTLSVTAGTLVYDDTTNRKLYCNLNASNIVTISIAIPAGTSTSAAQTRFGQLSADVSFGPAAYNGVAVDNFWTYLKAAYTTSGMSHDPITGVKSTAYSITAGAYYPYYLQTDDSTLPSTIAQSVATKSTDAVCYTNGADYTISKKYFYFLVPSAKSNKTIQQYVTGQWNNMNTTNDGTKTLTLNSGATASYKIYRTDELVPSTLKLRITT